MPTLAELRAQRPVHRPERALTICLAPHIVAEVQSLTDELQALAVAGVRGVDEDGNREGPPARMGDGEDPEADAIRARLAELLDEMDQHEGELRIRAVDDGEWRRWVNEHPARQKDVDPAGHARDVEVARGYCNADDLIDDLGKWAYTWDGEPLAEGDWGILAATIARPDKKQVARGVVGMHEQMDVDLPKWRTSLSATLKRSPGGGSLAASAVRPASSSAASPPSDTSTTTPTTD